MTIENELRKLTTAVEALTEALTEVISKQGGTTAVNEAAPAPKKKPASKPKPKAEPEPVVEEEDDLIGGTAEAEVTQDEVKAVMLKLIKGGQKEVAAAILKDLGADKLSELDPKHYAEALATLEAAYEPEV